MALTYWTEFDRGGHSQGWSSPSFWSVMCESSPVRWRADLWGRRELPYLVAALLVHAGKDQRPVLREQVGEDLGVVGGPGARPCG